MISRLYKQGTLRRRIERRMAMAAIETDDMDRYLDMLRSDAKELDLLATDLLINVTNFFRDPKVFDLLAERIIPDLVRSHSVDQPLRIWIAGCSTGEETYSLAMLFREEIAAAKREIKLQIFASDVDADAVATAREGLYPETIAADVSPERLARFFSKDEHGYQDSARAARHDRLHGAGRVGRSAILAPRPDFVPQSADLSAPRGAGEGHLVLPFRVARGWHSAAGKRRNDRRIPRPLRSDLESRSGSIGTSDAAGRVNRASCSEPARARGCRPADHRASRLRGKPRLPRCAGDW